jgi:hypothetical protein
LGTHEEGLLDVAFSNNYNFNEDVFEVTIATLISKEKILVGILILKPPDMKVGP